VFGIGEVVPGRGKGIHILELDNDTGTLREELPPVDSVNPSFLAIHPNGKFLYAVNELKEYEGADGGSVSAFAIEPDGGLRYLNTKPTGGQDPCHLCLDKNGRHLLIANYSSGSVCVYKTLPDGSLGECAGIVRHTGSGPVTERQAGAHAHGVIFDPNFNFLLVPDLGSDKVMTYKLDSASGRLSPALEPWFSCKPGAGPRSGEFHTTLPVFYCINELSSSVTVVRYDFESSGMEELQTISSLPPGCGIDNSCAALHVSSDGLFVYGSNRGHDSLMVYKVAQNDGTLEQLDSIPADGRTPRYFALTGSFVLVGNQDTDSIAVFTRDSDSGMLTQVSRYNTPMPVCILPV